MNATECEQLQTLIDGLMGRVARPSLTVDELMLVVGYLKGYQYLSARVAGEWQKAKELEAQYGIR